MSVQAEQEPGSFLGQFRVRHWAALVAIAMSLYHMTMPMVGEPVAEVHRPIHFMFALIVLFGFPGEADAAQRFPVLRRLWDFVLIALTITSSLYIVLNVEYVTTRLAYVTPLTDMEMVLSLAMVLVILEAARRTVGWVLTFITFAFIAYALLGNYLPDPFWHRGFGVGSILERLYLTLDGIWGVPLGVTASYVFLFILFGSILLKTGGGEFFSDFARAVAGRSAGGPAKSAVVASALMGTLSGSSPANVVTTGSFTIPAMKARGYPAHFAGGVEAAASTGGQLTPPIMGAAAFIMVEFTGIPYIDIIRHALIPAMLYFLAVFTMVSLEANRLGLRGDDPETVPKLWRVMKERGYLSLPIIVMIIFLAMGYTPSRAAFGAIVSLLALTLVIDPVNRSLFIAVCRDAMIHAAKVIGPVSVACACGGIIVGVVLMTGMGQKISAAVLTLSGGYVLSTLLLTTVVAVILGMGMPTSGAYIILAALLAPGIVALGLPVIAVHMFLLYGAAKSAITPPVAIASYAAAGIANSGPWETSLSAFKLAFGVFLIPYMFAYEPAILMYGEPLEIIHATVSAAIGIFFLCVGIIGWLWRPLNWGMRALVIAASFALVMPGLVGDLSGGTLIAMFLAWQWWAARNAPAAS